MDIPGGRPVAVHVKGAVPPDWTAIPRVQRTPIVQPSKYPYGVTHGRVGGVPSTSIDIILVYDTLFVSIAVTLKPYRPGPVLTGLTVPEIVPAALMVRPFGRQHCAANV